MRYRSLRQFALVTLAAFAAKAAGAQDPSMPGMQMDNQDSSAAGGAAAQGVHEQMTGMLMDSPHMRMTPLEPTRPGDAQRADSIVRALRGSLARYTDYRVALDDGFKIFLPKVKQKVYHFSSTYNAIYSAFTFDPTRPTSLLYEKTGDGYRLVGAMYTAPKFLTLAQLGDRVPLSVAQWHVHVNICIPPRNEPDRWRESDNGHPIFGPKGSIDSEAACARAGGRFIPQLFGWMIHVNPFETDPRLVWGTHDHDDQAERDHSSK